MKTRDHTIDIVRGIAIFTMIAANMAAYNYEEPHPFWFRVYGSFAAPAFVILSGFMVPYTLSRQNYGFMYYLVRGILVMLCGAAIDFFLWQLLPFTSYDVLYVIGLTLPFSYLFSRFSKWIHLAIALLLILVTPLLQWRLGYAATPAEVPVFDKEFMTQLQKAPVLRSFFVEGWFPVFPWMGVALLGSFAGRIRLELKTKTGNDVFLITGLSLFICGIVIWITQSPKLLVRAGYSELFYPPTVGYLFTFIGFTSVLIGVLQPLSNNMLLRFFAVFGRASLLMYILHTIIIVFMLKDVFDHKPLGIFIQLYLIHAFFLWWIALFVQQIKDHYPKMPMLLRFILGG